MQVIYNCIHSWCRLWCPLSILTLLVMLSLGHWAFRISLIHHLCNDETCAFQNTLPDISCNIFVLSEIEWKIIQRHTEALIAGINSSGLHIKIQLWSSQGKITLALYSWNVIILIHYFGCRGVNLPFGESIALCGIVIIVSSHDRKRIPNITDNSTVYYMACLV